MLRTRFIVLVALLGVTVAYLPAVADEGPPDPISLDRASPSVVMFGNTPSDIYDMLVVPPMPPAIPMGHDAGGPGPIVHVFDLNYGLGLQDNNDGHSNGERNPFGQLSLYFSGDDQSFGIPGTDYNHQAVRAQAAGDRFMVNGMTTLSPAQVMAGAGPSGIIGPIFPGGLGNFPTNLLSANQHRYNEIPSIGPAAFNNYVPAAGATPMDDMDALELTPFDLTGNKIHDTPIYFTLDAASPALAGGSAADILASPPTIAGFGLFAPAGRLGLGLNDDVDALAVWDVAGDLVADLQPMTDFALFSLAPGSPFLLNGGFSPADIFVTDFSGINALYLPAGKIGMLPGDNVDAIDVELIGPEIPLDDVPEPATLALLGLGGLAMLRRRRA